MHVRYAPIVLAALAVAALPGAAPAQRAARDYAEIFTAAIRSYAEYRDVAMDHVYIDTIACGRLVTRGPVPDRPRLVPVEAMRDRARTLGWHLAGEVSVFPLRERPADPGLPPDERAAFLFFVGLKPITDDSVVVSMRTETGVLLERRAYSDLMSFTFRHQDGEWVLLERKWETGEVREW